MQQIIDIDKFEELQELLVREIIEQIRFKLTQAGLKGEQLNFEPTTDDKPFFFHIRRFRRPCV